MKNVRLLHHLTMLGVVLCFATFIGIIVWSVNAGLAEIPEPWHTLGDRAFQVGLLLALVNAVLLGVLADHVGRSALLWAIGALFFAPLGLIVGYLRIGGLLRAREAANVASVQPA
jgi:hypothetical protein